MVMQLTEQQRKCVSFYGTLLSPNIYQFPSESLRHESCSFLLLKSRGKNTEEQILHKRTGVVCMGCQEVSVHFENLENRSRGLHVTWQPVRGDLTAHP